MPDRLDEIRARTAAATPGPWHAWDRGCGWRIALGFDGDGWPTAYLPEGHRTDISRYEDAEFIAHSRADMPWLCDEIDRLRAGITRLRDEHQPTRVRLDCGHRLPNGTTGHLPGAPDTIQNEDGEWLCPTGDITVCRACCLNDDREYLSIGCQEEHRWLTSPPCWPCPQRAELDRVLGIEVPS